jgi:trigger factor
VKDKKTASEEQGKEQLVDMPTALQHMKLPDEGDLEFKCEVEVKPEFELPSLEGVDIERPDVKVSDEDVTVQINRERARRGTWVPVNDGKVAIDDMLICDLVMTVDGKEIKKQENMQIAARPQRIEGVTLEDLGDSFKGAKVGESRKLSGTLVDDYEVEELRGKKAEFEFKLNDIKRMDMPPLDKAYLTSQGFENEKEYRDWVNKAMQGQIEQEIKKGMRNQVRKYFLDHTKLELPEGLSSRQTDRAVMRKMIELQRYGIPAAEIEKHADELRTSAREEVTADLKLHFILEDVAEKLEVDVTEEEVNGQIAEMARAYNRRFDRVRDDLAKNDGLSVLALQIREEKCLDKVLEKAKIVEAKVPKKGAEKAAKSDKPEKVEKSEKPKKADPAEAAPKAEKTTADKPAAAKPAKKASKKKSD